MRTAEERVWRTCGPMTAQWPRWTPARIELGASQTLPSSLIAGDSPVRVRRELRGITAGRTGAEQPGVGRVQIVNIEKGARGGFHSDHAEAGRRAGRHD